MKFIDQKQAKLARIKPLLKRNLKCRQSDLHFDFLTSKLKQQYNIKPSSNISGNQYDPIALSIIEEYKNGLILDCGSGKRADYLANVVNFEIVPYETTDVIGVGEELPFQDNCFDAVFSLAVLEHVKNPFQCAAEITRVMKPNGKLYCVVPFLQPVHGYPNHYYNMTNQGLQNLFERDLVIEQADVIASGLPIWTLSWFLNSWANDLDETTREEFLNLKVGELMSNPNNYLGRDFVHQLSKDKNFELASTTMILARKKTAIKKTGDNLLRNRRRFGLKSWFSNL